MFGNVSVVYSRDDTLRRLHKSAPQNKIDCIHALLDALHVFDISEAKIQTEI
jgi:phage terminase large subunit-like protein